MGLKLSFHENLQIMTQFSYLSHLVCEIKLFEKEFFSPLILPPWGQIGLILVLVLDFNLGVNIGLSS